MIINYQTQLLSFTLLTLSCSEDTAKISPMSYTNDMAMNSFDATNQMEDSSTVDARLNDDSGTKMPDALLMDAFTGGNTPLDAEVNIEVEDSSPPTDNDSLDSEVQDEVIDAEVMIFGSQGCGAETMQITGTYEIDVGGINRTYYLAIPNDYNANTPYKLIFVWHGLGGSIEAEINRNLQGLGDFNDGSAILVAGQGLIQSNPLNPDGPQRSGWSNANGVDLNFTRELLEHLRSELCIDNERIFSTGVSFGGIMTNRVGCELADEFRAIAPIMGQGPEVWNQSNCSRLLREADCAAGQVAAWITHGSADTVVPYCGGERSRDYWQSANSCTGGTVPLGDHGCLEYTDCDEDYPVVWCPTDLGHRAPAFSAEEIWTFFSRF